MSKDLKHPLKIAVEPGKKTELSDTSENKRATNKEGQLDETQPGGQSERRKILCPISTCKAKVIHLPRHMRNVHNWTKEAASKVLSKLNMRQCKDKRKNEKKLKTKIITPAVAVLYLIAIQLYNVCLPTCRRCTSWINNPKNIVMPWKMARSPQTASIPQYVGRKSDSIRSNGSEDAKAKLLHLMKTKYAMKERRYWAPHGF